MLLPDVLAQAAVASGLQLLRENPERAREFLVTLTDLYPELFAQAASFFGQTDIPVALGYALEPPPGAPVFIAVTLGTSGETDHYLGSDLGEETVYVGGDADFDEDDTPISTSVVEGVNIGEQVFLTVYGQNQNVVVWTANAARWALLRKRAAMQDAGLVAQRITMQDLRLDGESFTGDYVFRRVLTLSGTSNAEVSQVYTRHITADAVQVIDRRDPVHPYLDEDSEV